MNKKYFFYLIFSLSNVVALAQSVDPLTGSLQMSVPLGTLQANDISVPISVYHHEGGLKVAEGQSELGMGWSLSAGGSVVRVVRGIPDETNTTNRKGWLYNNNAQNIQNFSPQANDDLSICSDETNDWNFLHSLVGSYANDTEPDLFLVNAPGLSLKFVLAADGTPRLLNYQDVSISFQPSVYQPYAITIKTNTGVIYTFDIKEYIKRATIATDTTDLNTEYRYFRGLPPNDLPRTYISGWKLRTLSSSVTGTTATFTYNKPGPEEYFIPSGAGRVYYTADSTSFMLDTYYRWDLTSISLKSYTATFVTEGKLLKRVVINEANTLDKKEVQFEYITARNDYTFSRAYLTAIKFIGGSCLPNESQEFEYEGIPTTGTSNFTVPTLINWKKNLHQDLFGYPNGVAANKNLPKLYAYYNEANGRRLRVTPIPGVTADAIINGHDRTPTTSNVIFGLLKKIIYPTGGYIEIQYEPNKYVDNSTGEEFTGGGFRVKKLISQGGEIALGKAIEATHGYRAITKEYEYRNAANTQTSGVLLSPVKLGYMTRTSTRQVVDNMGDEPAVLYARVKEKVTGQGSTVYQFALPGVFPETAWIDWKATKSLIARKPGGFPPCLPTGNLKNGYYTYPYPPSTNYDFKRGQLESISEYSETNSLIREKTYGYSRKTNSPSTLKALRFEKREDTYHYGLYEIITGNTEVLSTEVVREASHEDASKWFQTTTNYYYKTNLLMDSVVSTYPNSTTVSKLFKYACDFNFTNPPSTDTAAVALKGLNDQFRSHEIVEQATKVLMPSTPLTISEAQLITYRDFGNGRILPRYFRTLLTGAALTVSSMSGQNFFSDPDYRTVKTMKEYDDEGRLLSAVDNSKNYVSSHYAVATSIPVATFSGITAQQALFEGFEALTSFGLTTVGTDFQYPAGWTGQKAIQFTSNTSKLVSSDTRQVQKNGNLYRISFWVYSKSGKAITFKAKTGALENNLSLVNTVDNKWTYVEGEINLNVVGSQFTLEVQTNASIAETVILDDILFVPVRAVSSLQTVLPFKGVTSSTDDNGNSSKVTYDPMGRVLSTLDKNRNLVQKNEYVVKNVKEIKPNSGFAVIDGQVIHDGQYFIGEPVTFTPSPYQCDPLTTYAWEVDGVSQVSGPGNVLVYTFDTPGPHGVTLTALSSDNRSSSSSANLCVEYFVTGGFSVAITDQNGNEINTFDCNSVPSQINYTVVPPAGFPPDCLITTSWQTSYQSDGSGGTEFIYTATYEVNCASYKGCPFASQSIYNGQASNSITQVYNANCQ